MCIRDRFYRFISENLTAYLNDFEHRAGHASFDYARLADADAQDAMDEVVNEKGFFIFPSDLFANVRARARHDQNLNETLSRVFANIEASAHGTASEDDFKGLFDDLDVNSSKLGPTAVSYTHLDVYKRQRTRPCAPGVPRPRTPRPPRSPAP